MKRSFLQVKRELKILRWQARRRIAARRFGAKALEAMPIVFGNAIPKSGSHLIDQVLRGLPRLGPFIDTGFPPVNRDGANNKLAETNILHNLQQLCPGDLGYGYLHCKPPFIEALTAPGMATVFVYRDPRDVAVSVVKYATEMQLEHGLHAYFTHTLRSDAERINFVIRGSDREDLSYSSLNSRYEKYLGWLSQPVLSLRFEDLRLHQAETLNRLLDHLAGFGFVPQMPREQAIEILAQSIQPKRSGTFRKGKPGGWKDYFTEQNKTLFKELAGDLLIGLGYEKDMDW